MAKQQAGAPQGQSQPGMYFRVPKVGTSERFVPDSNNEDITTTLSSQSQSNANTQALDRLDIVRTLYLDFTITEAYTAGTGQTVTTSSLFPYNWVNLLTVQFESAFKTFNLPGWLAAVVQQYRPARGWKGNGVLTANGVNSQQGEQVTAAWTTNPQSVGLTGTGVARTTSPLNLFFEVPLAFEFDVYYDLDLAGNPTSAPQVRAIVSPQYLSGTTRVVKPNVTYSPGLVSPTGGELINGPVATTAVTGGGATPTTFTGSAELEVSRDGWFMPANIATTPRQYRWQYSRDYIQQSTNGQGTVTVPLDSDPAGQGQILSLILAVWDPALNSGAGGIAPTSSIASIELLFGSKLQRKQQSIAVNAAEWLGQHGTLLPPGFFGWDLALDGSGRLTNENALNTLITAGCQVRVTYNSGAAPSSTATIFTALEMLKSVTS